MKTANRTSSIFYNYSAAFVFLALLLVGAGIYAYFSIPRTLEPDTTFPYASIEAKLPGVTAEELEKMVTLPVEQKLRQIGDVVNFHSSTYDGYMQILIEVEDTGLLDDTIKQLKVEMDFLHQQLSRTIIGLEGPSLNQSMDSHSDLIVGIPVPADQFEASYDAIQVLSDSLADLPEVDKTKLIGRKEAQLVVEYLDKDLDGTGLTPTKLRNYLSTQSFLATGGYYTKDGILSPVQVDARLKSLDDLKNLDVMDTTDGGVSTLQRLLDVKKEYSELFAHSVTVDGKPGVCLAITRNKTVAPSLFSQSCQQLLTEKCHALGLEKPEVLIDNSVFINRDVHDLRNGLIISAVIVFIILVIILGFQAGSIVAVMIPTCIFSTLTVLHLLGYSLNLVTLAGLIIAIGVIVDNHVVISQSVSYKVNMGIAHSTALTDSLRKLTTPLLVATLTTIVGFVPVVLADHDAGRYVSELLPVVAVALGFSLIYAFFITPMICRKGHRRKPYILFLEQQYSRLMTRLCKFQITTCVTVILVVLLGIGILRTLPVSFFPTKNRPILVLEMQHPFGRSVNYSRKEMDAFSSRIAPLVGKWRTNDRSFSWMTFAGRGLPRITRNMIEQPATPNYSVSVFSFADEKQMNAAKQELEPYLQKLNADIITRLAPITVGPQLRWPVKLIVSGSRVVLEEQQKQILETLQTTSGVTNVHSSSGTPVKKLVVIPKRKEAAARGITAAEIAMSMSAVLNGIPCMELNCAGQPLPVILRPKIIGTDPELKIRDAYVYPQ
ncbi:hypothetical protein BVY04_01220, partial [bacterium M21]